MLKRVLRRFFEAEKIALYGILLQEVMKNGEKVQ